MAVKLAPPPGFLAQFANPLWRVAGLIETRALSIVQGTRGGYPFTVLELEHRSTHVMHERTAATTTFFILKLGRSSDHWQNDVFSSTGASVWVDQDNLFLARIGADTPVADWNALLAMAIAAAGQATDVASPVPRPQPRLRAADDQKIVLFWVAVAGLLPALEWLWGLTVLGQAIAGRLFGLCQPDTGSAAFMIRHDEVLFGLALCLPLLGHFLGMRVMHAWYGRPGFSWRIFGNGVLVAALAMGGLVLAFQYTSVDLDQPGSRLRCSLKNVPAR